MKKEAPRKPATSEEVTNSLEAVRAAELSLSEAKTVLKKRESEFEAAKAAYEAAKNSRDEAREDVRSMRAKLRSKKRTSKRAFNSALNRKPFR